MRSKFSTEHPEFNDFLFTSIGKERAGIRLTVLSALARLGFDPWQEAARLSGLTRDAAAGTLASAFRALPKREWQALDLASVAAGLVKLLPAAPRPSWVWRSGKVAAVARTAAPVRSNAALAVHSAIATTLFYYLCYASALYLS
jgi:hypothetical protein